MQLFIRHPNDFSFWVYQKKSPPLKLHKTDVWTTLSSCLETPVETALVKFNVLHTMNFAGVLWPLCPSHPTTHLTLQKFFLDMILISTC